jgi:hypothetical protein
MLTIQKCREILEKNNEDLPKEEKKINTDEEIIAIREWMYKMAKINIDYIKEKLNSGIDLQELVKEQETLAQKEVKTKHKKK